jgi:DNA-binding CsgD family transcriptional regulator
MILHRLDRLRPWLAHALHQASVISRQSENWISLGAPRAPVLSGQILLAADATIVYQTAGLEQLLTISAGEPVNPTRFVPARDKLPAPISKLLEQLTGAANGTSNTPPRTQISTPYGIVTLEAKWLLPANTLPADVAKDPKSCLVAVTIELREHSLANAARVLRESGTTPAQMKVGIELAMGKSKPAIAKSLRIAPSTVASLTKQLYQTLDIHNSTELAARIWLGQKHEAAHQIIRRTA